MERKYGISGFNRYVLKALTTCLIVFALSIIMGINVYAQDYGTWYWPVPSSSKLSRGIQYENGKISHAGIDIVGDYGCNIHAAKSGKVVRVIKNCDHVALKYEERSKCTHKPEVCDGYDGDLYYGGNTVSIRHNDGTYSVYSHLKKGSVTVSAGDEVVAGQIIGQMGKSGYATGVHLHFGVRYGGSSSWSGTIVDPQKLTYSNNGGESTTPTPSTSAFPFVDGQTYIIRNALSGKAIEVPGGNSTAGAQVKVWSYDSSGNSPWQRWIAQKCSDGYMFINAYTGQVMDIRDASTAGGAVLQQWTKHGGGAQRFKVIDAGGGKYGLKNINSDLALDLCGSNTANGAIIDQHSYHGGSNQLWTFEPVNPDTTAPVISNIRVTDVSSSGYTVICDVTDNLGVDRVQFPTWTDYNGQDDLAPAWGISESVKGVQSGNTYSFRVNIWDHYNEHGSYQTHIYAYDGSGNYSCEGVQVTVPEEAYNLYLNPNGGHFSDWRTSTVKASPQLVYRGWNWNDVSGYNPYRNGFTFNGWYTRSNGGTKVYEANGVACYEGTYWSGDGYVYPGDLTVYASWSRNSYILDVNPVINDAEYKSGIAGYTFNLTVRDDNGNDVTGTYGATNVPDYYGEIPYGYTYTVTPTGNLDGYTAAGCSGTIEAQINYAVPVWARNSYTLDVNPMINGVDCGNGLKGYTFTLTMKDENGKDVSDVYGAVEVLDYYRTEIPYGYSYTITPTGNLEGYVAVGCNGVIKAEHNVAIPKWDILKYTITYDANGGSSAPEAQTKEYGKIIRLSTQKPARAGYLLSGWNTQADGKGKVYKSGVAYADNSNLTLYAQWKMDTKYQKSISKVTISKIKSQSYTGSEIRPEITVKLGKIVLTQGTDYQISYENNVQAGKASVTVTGLGDYIGTKTVTFNIVGDSIKRAKVSGIEPKVYDGSRQTQDIFVQLGDIALTENEDYTVSYAKNINAGTAIVTITGINGYVGTIKKNFKIAAYDISKDEQAKISEIPEYITVVYEKGGCTPEVIPRFENVELKKGKDYAISYANNKKVTPDNLKSAKSVPVITIKGKGNFKGTIKVNFKIEAKNLDQVTATVADVKYSPKAGKYISNPVLTDTNGKVLKAGADYTVTYTREDGTKLLSKSAPWPGTKIIVTITGKGYYTGEITKTYKVLELNTQAPGVSTTQSVGVSGGDAGTVDGNLDVSGGDVPVGDVIETDVSDGNVTIEDPAAETGAPEAGQPVGGTVDGADNAA